jgi:hypothetical protein
LLNKNCTATTNGIATILAVTGLTQSRDIEIIKLDIVNPKDVTMTNFVIRLKVLFFFLKFSVEFATNEIKEAIATERMFPI